LLHSWFHLEVSSAMRLSLARKAVHHRLHGGRLVGLGFELDLYCAMTFCLCLWSLQTPQTVLWSPKAVSGSTNLIFLCSFSAKFSLKNECRKT
jgi:hypothetical protein